ncbi:DUF1566 domain-containing protein [Pseudomonas sp. GD03860]|uniref:DUF1566 domain-containing protein n=1 Tax=Pseudomonas sp. GD03860 TaxID=2975389 RepID=UPI00244785C7|nr:DUF1566 domain-containing protein [Pseudomonas sp. GD03860]MDH0638236.1 DUF1566 domain-containing protein [Pseudomonas sp. GD03860]
MKSEMVKLEHKGLKFKMSRPVLAELAIASVFAQALPPAANVQSIAHTDIPAVGQQWPGQGGINGGLVPARGDVPEHYLIIAAKDIGDHAWGGYREESKATSKTDGMANSAILLEEGSHPAASAASKHAADNHNDFYLPAAAELYHCWVNCPEVFAQDCYYWSSSQRSAYTAFLMHFDVGIQLNYCKHSELRVRPVRRVFI